MTKDSVLAVYDFRSKQEYIYRTNRMREITGASEIIATMFHKFLNPRDGLGMGARIRNDWDATQPRPVVDPQGIPLFDDNEDGIVVYEGGGNLLVFYRNRPCYVSANKEFSRLVVHTAGTLSMISACTSWNPNETFRQNAARAFRELDVQKRIGDADVPCNVLPFTQVDRVTFQPIVGERSFREEKTGEVLSTQQITTEAKAKLDAFDALPPSKRTLGASIDNLGLKKGEDSLIAVMYFDGNSIGEKVKAATAQCACIADEIAQMRKFSVELHNTLVKQTEARMKDAIDQEDEQYRGYRVIIDHGDEITFICNAHVAPLALKAYFDSVEASNSGYHACGGMVFCHSHDPFASVYRLAEECCESGKHRNRTEQASGSADASFVDFHFARSGITGDLDQIRSMKEHELTARPYRLDEYQAFMEVGRALASPNCKLQRSDMKALNRALLRGRSWYQIELMRLEAKDPSTIRSVRQLVPDDELLRLLLADVTSYWDVFDLAFRPTN